MQYPPIPPKKFNFILVNEQSMKCKVLGLYSDELCIIIEMLKTEDRLNLHKDTNLHIYQE